jgi:hypothetical protein
LGERGRHVAIAAHASVAENKTSGALKKIKLWDKSLTSHDCNYLTSTEWSKSLCAPDDYNTEYYLAPTDCLAGDRKGQGNTRLTLKPSVIPNSNHVIMVSDWNCLKHFCVFFVL